MSEQPPRQHLSVRTVSAGYNGTVVLIDVSLSISVGETVLLLGPNGHGKTTLARVICGEMRPQRGEVWFRGERIDESGRAGIRRAGIVHVPQGDLLFPEMTVLDNLFVAAGFDRNAWRDRRNRAADVLELFPALAARRRQDANTLSGGERRMLAIGRGLMTPSSLVIVDEPALGLAPIVVDEVYATINQLAAQDERAILLIDESATHVDMVDRVVIMQRGMIVHDLSPTEFLHRPDLVDAYFVGLPQ